MKAAKVQNDVVRQTATLSFCDIDKLSYRDAEKWLIHYNLPKSNTLTKRKDTLKLLFKDRPKGYKLVRNLQ